MLMYSKLSIIVYLHCYKPQYIVCILMYDPDYVISHVVTGTSSLVLIDGNVVKVIIKLS